MPKKKKVDSKTLIKAVEAGKTQAEIMSEFGYKSSAQVKTAYMNALIEAGKVTPIIGGRGSKATKAKAVGVGKRGSIIISKEMVDRLEIGADDKFTIRKTKAGIALKRV
jgi:hypothetical protein